MYCYNPIFSIDGCCLTLALFLWFLFVLLEVAILMDMLGFVCACMFTCARPAVGLTVLPLPPMQDTDITAVIGNMEALTGMFYGILHA